jgi:hypothetical protein
MDTARHKPCGCCPTQNLWELARYTLWELPEVTTVANAVFQLPEMC